jgi:uncharacterized damage-inducible protein DinB
MGTPGWVFMTQPFSFPQSVVYSHLAGFAAFKTFEGVFPMKLPLALLTSCFTAVISALPAFPQATPAAAPTLPGEAKQAYVRVRGFILKAVDKVPEEDYAFQPTPAIRTFSQLIDHIADVQTRICSTLNGQPKPSPAAAKTKAQAAAAIKQSFDECDKAYDSVTPENMSQLVSAGPVQRSKLALLFGNVSHDNEMYGTMSVYMRLKGIVPPSSEPAPPK